MKSGDIVWWTTRTKGRESKRWTAFPVIFLRRGDFTHVQGLIGRWRGREFSVVNNEISSYIPMGTQLALGAKKYLAQYEAQQYARRQKLTQLKGSSTQNDPDKWRARRRAMVEKYGPPSEAKIARFRKEVTGRAKKYIASHDGRKSKSQKSNFSRDHRGGEKLYRVTYRLGGKVRSELDRALTSDYAATHIMQKYGTRAFIMRVERVKNG